MPRKSRESMNTNYLHIMVQGINKEYIFNEEKEMQKYLSILNDSLDYFKLKIVAYCIMNNHVHLLIYTQKIEEVSKLMSKVNTRYAIYYNKKHNRCGYVFRNRYRAEEIYTKAHLISCINYIHNNPVKANMCKNKHEYKYSSYNDYINKTGFIDNELIEQCFKSNGIDYRDIAQKNYECYKFIEYSDFEEKEKNKKIIIKEFLKSKNISFEQIKTNGDYLKELVIELYVNANIMQKEIGEILGISKIKVHRIIKNEFSGHF